MTSSKILADIRAIAIIIHNSYDVLKSTSLSRYIRNGIRGNQTT